MSSYSLTDDDFAFSPDAMLRPPESMLYYRPGGFHPVMLGDVINSTNARYHIVQKLGWGGSATVWLAQDLGSLDWFALRIRASECVDEGEDEVLEHIASESRSPHLPTVREAFSVMGPNGTHTVTATDVVSPLDGTLRRLPAASVHLKAIVRGVVEGMAHMHAAGIVHGDLHIGNVGLAMPSLRSSDYGGNDPYRPACSSIPDVIVVLARSQAAHAHIEQGHLPRYLVSPVDLALHYEKLARKLSSSYQHVVKIFDFGNSYRTEHPRSTNGFMDAIIPPEWAVRREASEHEIDIFFDASSDIWALGLMIFGIMAQGKSLFPRGSDFREAAKLAGKMPQFWNESFPGATMPAANEVTPEVSQRLWQRHWESLRPTCVSDEDANALVALLQKILVLDPASRPTAMDILRDPWFSITDRSADAQYRNSLKEQPIWAGPAYTAHFSHQPQLTTLHGNSHNAQGIPVHPSQHGPWHPNPQYRPFPPEQAPMVHHPFSSNPSYNPYPLSYAHAPYPSPFPQAPYFPANAVWSPHA